MRRWQGKRYWVVGASEGLGRALSAEMSRAGAELVLSARSEDGLKEVAEGLPGPATVAPMDVSDAQSVAAAAKTAGDVDGVVILAAVYWPIKASEWDAEKVEAMGDINFNGALRVLGHVMPGMIERDAGHVVLTGSLSGFRGLPGAIGYGATKAALMSLAESMHYDLKDTGIDVQISNPGFIKTRTTDKNDFNMPFIMSPEKAAAEMFELMKSDRFKKSFPRLFSYVFRGSQFLPDWLYYRMFKS